MTKKLDEASDLVRDLPDGTQDAVADKITAIVTAHRTPYAELREDEESLSRAEAKSVDDVFSKSRVVDATDAEFPNRHHAKS